MVSKLPSDVRKPKCCSCNGLNARCKLCICVKSGRSCTDCQPMKRGVCVNSIQSTALSSTNSASTESTNSTCSQPLIPSCICPKALPVTSHSQPLPQSPQQPQPPQQSQPRASMQSLSQPKLPPVFGSQHINVDAAVDTVVNQRFTRVFGKHRPATSLPCPVSSCCEHVLPSMWKIHMDRQASGALPGKIPQGWLSLNQYSVCSSCSTLVAISHTHAHISGSNSCVTDINHAVDTNDPGVTMDHEYPSFDDIFSTSFPTIKRIPVCARQAVGRGLLGILQSIVFQESIIAWKKLFMFPKCILYCKGSFL